MKKIVKIILITLIFIYGFNDVYAQSVSKEKLVAKYSKLHNVEIISGFVSQKTSEWVKFIDKNYQKKWYSITFPLLSDNDAAKLKTDMIEIQRKTSDLYTAIKNLTERDFPNLKTAPNYLEDLKNHADYLKKIILIEDESQLWIGINNYQQYDVHGIKTILYDISQKTSNIALKIAQWIPSEDLQARNLSSEQRNKLTQGIADDAGISISFKPGVIETEIDKPKPIAVFAPGLFGEEASSEGYEKITPIGLVYTIRDYLFKIANELFILLVVIGGIFYIFITFKADYKKEADRWILSAIKGYIILLVASAIISALKFLFGAPK